MTLKCDILYKSKDVRFLTTKLMWTLDQSRNVGYHVMKLFFQLQTSMKCVQFLITLDRFNSYHKEPVFENFFWVGKTFSQVDI